MPRCCTPIPNEFTPCYASVLVAPNLRQAVEDVESAPLTSCVTSWCSRCQRTYLLTPAVALFPLPSAHHAHVLAMQTRRAE